MLPINKFLLRQVAKQTNKRRGDHLSLHKLIIEIRLSQARNLRNSKKNLRIIQVGRWPLCPILPTLGMGNKICEVIYLKVLGAGGRGAEATVLLGGHIRLAKN